MFPRQRRERILAMLEASGHVTVDQLSQAFGVSVDSIRKDLGVLAKAGLCRREYGGACRVAPPVVIPTSSPVLADTSDTTLIGTEGSLAIAQRAWEEINDGDAIFLDVSRINLLLADLIAQGNKRLIVTTNMLEIPQRLAGNPLVSTLATGGHLNAQLTGFLGSTTISLLEPLLFGKAFIGVHGVNVTESAVMAFDTDDGAIKQRVLANASQSYLMANRGKFYMKDGYRFASINDFTTVITDENNSEVISAVEASGCSVLRAVTE